MLFGLTLFIEEEWTNPYVVRTFCILALYCFGVVTAAAAFGLIGWNTKLFWYFCSGELYSWMGSLAVCLSIWFKASKIYETGVIWLSSLTLTVLFRSYCRLKISSYFSWVFVPNPLRILWSRHVNVLISHLRLYHVHCVFVTIHCNCRCHICCSLLRPGTPGHQLIHTYNSVGSWILRTSDNSSSVPSLELVVGLERWWLPFRRVCYCHWMFWILHLLWLPLLLCDHQLLVVDDLLAHLALFEFFYSHLHWVLVLNTRRRPLNCKRIRIRVTCVAISVVVRRL